jgi:hypothetical protein
MVLDSPWLRQGWDDGLAEVAEYTLQQYRYGALHPGTATLVAVREAMDGQRAVKALPSATATISVLKLHWIRSFQTGSYRYDQSSFQLVRQDNGLPLRWLISSHEWCGTAGKSWINGGPLRTSSYFDGHGDVEQRLDLGTEGVPADSLWWWARAWVANGARQRTLRLVPSQIDARCVDTTPGPATISGVRLGASGDSMWQVVVDHAGGQDRLHIATEAPHRLLSWQQADGSQLTLRSLRRFDYWNYSRPQDRPYPKETP